MHKDLRKVIKALEDQGFDVRKNARNHYEVRKNGRKVATFASTPSDWRGWLNSIADAKRAGFKWPRDR